MKSELEQRLRTTNRELRRENLRFRELIELLSSQAEILRNRLSPDGADTSSRRLFESFASVPAPELGPVRRARIKAKSLPTPLNPPPGWKCLTVDRKAVRLGFTLFGVTREAIEEAAAKVEQRQLRTRDFAPLFVTDSPVFDVFRRRGWVVEYIPPPIAQTNDPRSPKYAYLERRLELIKAKWNLSSFVDMS
jgi:hypothetical protein